MADIWRNINYLCYLLSELVFPRKCDICKNIIHEGFVCDICRKQYLLNKILYLNPREEYLANQAEVRFEDVLDSILILYKYDGVYRDSLHKTKFEFNNNILNSLHEEANIALSSLGKRWLSQFDIATSIPTSPERYIQRGYDVPQEIFKYFLGSIYCKNILYRKRSTKPLFDLSPEERRCELRGCFQINSNINLYNKKILVCDDIFTTGSTFAEAAEILKKYGAKEVHGVSFTAARLNW